MQIQCECGKFRAELPTFPHNTPGRAVCYCDDCQTFLHHLGRVDLLDASGGTEIIPVYPSEFKIIEGRGLLKCTLLTPNGLPRWWVACCKTPIANTRHGFPWVGLNHRVFKVKDPSELDQKLGPIKSRIQGRYAQGTPPEGTSPKMSFKDIMVVFPFVMKGFLFGKAKNSPFFEKDGSTPIVTPEVLPVQVRNSIRQKLGFK